MAWPPGGSGPAERAELPVVVVLHGRGNDHASAFSRRYLALDRFLASVVAGGTAPFALASIDGGETYWHARDDGEDAGAMVVDEFLPLLAGHGLRTDRIGFLGWSMGGFGALHLARTLGPERVAAVGAMSPALWHHFKDTAPGAYDDAEDFADVDLMGRQDDLAGIAVRIDCGRGDPFLAASRDFVHGFEARPAGGFQRGDHDRGYWRRMAPAQLTFLGSALEAPANVSA
nr:alpha/beta hydrolase-fold protein [Mumia xiangluensis]